MASRVNVPFLAYNRGRVSDLALARTDIERMALSAEEQVNWMPRSLGSMMLRAGLEYRLGSRNHAEAIYIPFVFSSTDSALIEITDGAARAVVDDALIARGSVATAFSNGSFDSDLTGWADEDEAGATSVWATGGYLSLSGTGSTAAIRTQSLSIGASDQGAEHAVTLIVTQGRVDLRIGSTAGDEDLLAAINLGVGSHYLTFTPNDAAAYVELSSVTKYASLVDSIAISAAGTLVMDAPWSAADLPYLRWSQSGDILYVACKGNPQYKIERRTVGSWSVVRYLPEDGPFRNINPTPTTLTPSAISGNITVTASSSVFKDGHVGALFSLDSVGQKVEGDIGSEAAFTDPIRVSGVGAARRFTFKASGTWAGTVRIQRSVSEPGAWVDVTSYTSNVNSAINDGFDNQIIYYRIGIKSGEYTSGTAEVEMEYSGGSLTGVFRVTDVTSSTEVSATVLRDLGGTSGNTIWAEGIWSDQRGWPSAVALYEGRLWWAGKGSIIGSASDAYESFDENMIGDAGPLNRTIGYGPVDSINWMLPVQRLIIGTDGAEVSARSTSFDEPLTPANFNLKNASTQGSSPVAAVVVDTTGIFVQKSGTRVYEVAYDAKEYDYSSSDLSVLVPEIGEPSISRMAVQRQPDTRVHCVRSDGTVAVLVFDRAESVICWVEIETDGEVEDCVVLPGTVEDQVYYLVKRTIGGETKRYLEKWAKESECQGGLLNKQADSFLAYDSTETTTIAGLDHLEGESVVVWADGLDVGTRTVSGGSITLSTAASKVVAGLPYEARYKSTKLAYGAQAGTALMQRKRVSAAAFMLKNTHIGGLRFGPSFDELNDLPLVEAGREYGPDHIYAAYDFDSAEFPGDYSTDARICLQAAAPRPATVLATVLTLELNEKL